MMKRKILGSTTFLTLITKGPSYFGFFCRLNLSSFRPGLLATKKQMMLASSLSIHGILWTKFRLTDLFSYLVCKVFASVWSEGFFGKIRLILLSIFCIDPLKSYCFRPVFRLNTRLNKHLLNSPGRLYFKYIHQLAVGFIFYFIPFFNLSLSDVVLLEVFHDEYI